MSRLAAATTIPVTNNAIQENSKKSLTTLPMIAPRAAPNGSGLPPTPSASPYHDQNWQRQSGSMT